jgi:hypothetical protein
MGHKQSACMNDWCCTTCGKDGHKRKECTSSLSSDSAQSDSSDDESCSVDNVNGRLKFTDTYCLLIVDLEINWYILLVNCRGLN